MVNELLVGGDPFKSEGRFLALLDGEKSNRPLARWNSCHASSLVDEVPVDEGSGELTTRAWAEGAGGELQLRSAYDLALRQSAAAYGLDVFKDKAEKEFYKFLEMRRRDGTLAAKSLVLSWEEMVQDMDHLEMEHAAVVFSRLTASGASQVLWVLGLLHKHHGLADLGVAARVCQDLGPELLVEFQMELTVVLLARQGIVGHVMARRWMKRLLGNGGLGGVVVNVSAEPWTMGPAVVQRVNRMDQTRIAEWVAAAQQNQWAVSPAADGLGAVMAEFVEQVEVLMDPQFLGEHSEAELVANSTSEVPTEALREFVELLTHKKGDLELWEKMWAGYVREYVHPLYGVEGMGSVPAEKWFQFTLDPITAMQVAEVVLRWRHELTAEQGQVLPTRMVEELRSLEWTLVAKWDGMRCAWEQPDPEERDIWDGMGMLAERVWPGRRGKTCRDWRVLELVRPVAYCAVESMMKALGFMAEDETLASARPAWLEHLWDPNQGGLTFRAALGGAMQASAKFDVIRNDDEKRRFLCIWGQAAGVGPDDVQEWLHDQPFKGQALLAYARYAAGRPSLANQFGGIGETLYALDHFRPTWIVGPLSRVV
ncbi:hypothetical protein N9C85_01630 [Synechococcus sp. AH-224-I15]|nr:hypothetical protein [Synechococcus sp. AH-224-I15]